MGNKKENASRKTPEKMAVGQRVSARREFLNMSQDDLAESINHSRIAVALWETGTNSIPSEYLMPLSKTLGVSVRWILSGAEDEYELNPDDRDMLRFFHDLEADLKPTGKALLRALVEEQRRKQNAGTVGKKAE